MIAHVRCCIRTGSFWLFVIVLAWGAGTKKTSAQYTYWQSWSSIEVSKNLSAKWQLLGGSELRLKNYASQLRVFFTEGGVQYQVFPRLSVSTTYRLLIKPDRINHRVYSDVQYEWRYHFWETALRLRLQHQFEAKQDETYVRPQLTLTYRKNKKWRPYVRAEMFGHLFHHRGNPWDELRLSAGTRYRLQARHRLIGALMHQRSFHTLPVQRNWIFQATYQYSF